MKWVAITDRWTWTKTIGRSNHSWDDAMSKAIAEMRRLATPARLDAGGGR